MANDNFNPGGYLEDELLPCEDTFEDTFEGISQIKECQVSFRGQIYKGNNKLILDASFNDKDVAIKGFIGIKNEIATSESLKEMKLMMKLNHPKIISFYGGIFSQDKNPLLVMEKIDTNLFDYLTKTKLDLFERIHLAKQVSLGIQKKPKKKNFTLFKN